LSLKEDRGWDSESAAGAGGKETSESGFGENLVSRRTEKSQEGEEEPIGKIEAA